MRVRDPEKLPEYGRRVQLLMDRAGGVTTPDRVILRLFFALIVVVGLASGTTPIAIGIAVAPIAGLVVLPIAVRRPVRSRPTPSRPRPYRYLRNGDPGSSIGSCAGRRRALIAEFGRRNGYHHRPDVSA